MLTIRPARWPDDAAALAGLDTSFTTERIYRVVCEELGFTLVEEPVDPPLWKSYGPISPPEPSAVPPIALVAELDDRVAGYAVVEFSEWNRRLQVSHLYVAPECRGRGVGTALLAKLEWFGRTFGARCLWVETQNVNLPAVEFYLRRGFRLCGLDTSLYDPAEPGSGEVALFLSRDLS
ncbi:MAG: GNAT family N-acetyltransferase [Armatimonadota bacterium]